MTNRYFQLAIAFFCLNIHPIAAQTAFSNQTGLLQNQNVHSGVAIAVLDMNGDGLDDIVRMDDGTEVSIEYQNAPNNRFGHKAVGSVANDSQWGMCAADIDNNGFPDVIAGGSYDGVKIVMADQTGANYTTTTIEQPSIFTQNMNLADIDNDGWVDAFVCHDDGPSQIFMNDGTGQLVHTPNVMNFATVPSSDMSGNYGSLWVDVDNDNDLDLYIAKCRQNVTDSGDGRRINQLFLNNGDGTYTQDLANASGLRIGAQSWTAAFGDIDNDGDLDCFVTNHDVNSQVLENDGAGHFTDITEQAKMAGAITGLPIQGVFRDFDNDGYLDILVSGMAQYIFHNNGDKTFTPVEGLFNNNQMESFALGDLNADGFVDIYGGYAQIYTQPSGIHDVLWMNNGNSNHFWGVTLQGTQSNRSGIGAKITLYTPQGLQMRDLRSGESYGIMNSLQMQFGLGQNTLIDSVVVRWPSGHVDVLHQLVADTYITLKEGGCMVPQSTVTTTGNPVFCTGQSIELQAASGYGYLWSNGDTTQTITITQAGIYQVTLTNAGECSAASKGFLATQNPDETPTVVAQGDLAFCAGGSVVLTASPSNAYAWSNGATTQSIEVGTAGLFAVQVVGQCSTFVSQPIEVKLLPSALPVPQTAVTWVGGSADLNATGDEPHWYDAASGGIELGIGNTFTTPPLAQTTTFWVSNNDIEDQPNEHVGMIDQQGGIANSSTFNGQLIFDCFKPVRLASAKFYTTKEGERKILLIDAAGNELQSKVVMIPAGTTVVELGIDIPAGNDLILTTDAAFNDTVLGSAGPQLRRSDSGVLYPYVIDEVISLKNSNAPTGPENRYYYFFDMELDFYGKGCMSDRVPVEAKVDPNLVPANDLANPFQIKVFPNPAQGKVSISQKGLGGEALQLNLFDAQGKRVFSQNLQCSNDLATKVDFSNLPKGIYLMEMKGAHFVKQEKLVLMHD